MSTAISAQSGARRPGRTPDAARNTKLAQAGDWAKRAPLLPALIFTIIVTQLPFVATLVISFMN